MDSQPKRKANLWMMSTLVLVGIIAGFGISKIPYFENIGSDAKVAAVDQQEEEDGNSNAPQTLTAEQMAALEDDDFTIGSVEAPITVVEFTDFQCPYCARFSTLTFPQIDENYIKSGKVKFVIRDFPLDFHAQSQLASESVQCASDQTKFREMHDMIFIKQTEWAGNEKAADLMKSYAQELGLDTNQFNECLSSNKYTAEVRKDLIDGATLGVNGTPSFFINGKIVSGAMPYELIFKPIFDAELAGKQWEIQYDASGIPSVKAF